MAIVSVGHGLYMDNQTNQPTTADGLPIQGDALLNWYKESSQQQGTAWNPTTLNGMVNPTGSHAARPPTSPVDPFMGALNTYNPNFFNPGYQVWENDPNGQQNPSYMALQNALQGGGTTLGNFAKDFGTQNQASIDQLSGINYSNLGDAFNTFNAGAQTKLGGLGDYLGGLRNTVGNLGQQSQGLMGQTNNTFNPLLQQASALQGGLAGQYNPLIARAGGLTTNDLQQQLAAMQGYAPQQQYALAGQLGALGQNTLGQLSNVQNQYGQMINGVDPRFEALRQSQFNQLNTDQQNQQAQTSEFFNRRGLGDTSAALNELNKLGSGFSQQRQNLTAQLNMDQLQRQDQALANYGNLAAQQGQIGSGFLGQQAGLYQGGDALLSQILGQRGAFVGQESGLIGNQANILGQLGQQQQGLLGLQGNLGSQQLGQLQNLLGQQGSFAQMGAGFANEQANMLGMQGNLLNQQQQFGLAQNQAQQGLYGQLAQMQANNQAQQLGMFGQQMGLEQALGQMGQQAVDSRNTAQQLYLQSLTAGLQNLTIPQTLQTAQTAAGK